MTRIFYSRHSCSIRVIRIILFANPKNTRKIAKIIGLKIAVSKKLWTEK